MLPFKNKCKLLNQRRNRNGIKIEGLSCVRKEFGWVKREQEDESYEVRANVMS
jgi:hypothetical protein